MATDDFFRARLDSMIDMRHPLVVLATRMPWAEIEASLPRCLRTRIAVAVWFRMPISSERPRSSRAPG
jgi:anti-sigma factor RsiW